DAEDARAFFQLGSAERDDRGSVVVGVARLGAVRSVAALAVRAGDEHGPHTLGGVFGKDAAGGGGLVVGVGVDGHQAERRVGYRLFHSRGARHSAGLLAPSEHAPTDSSSSCAAYS